MYINPINNKPYLLGDNNSNKLVNIACGKIIIQLNQLILHVGKGVNTPVSMQQQRWDLISSWLNAVALRSC